MLFSLLFTLMLSEIILIHPGTEGEAGTDTGEARTERGGRREAGTDRGEERRQGRI